MLGPGPHLLLLPLQVLGDFRGEREQAGKLGREKVALGLDRFARDDAVARLRRDIARHLLRDRQHEAGRGDLLLVLGIDGRPFGERPQFAWRYDEEGGDGLLQVRACRRRVAHIGVDVTGQRHRGAPHLEQHLAGLDAGLGVGLDAVQEIERGLHRLRPHLQIDRPRRVHRREQGDRGGGEGFVFLPDLIGAPHARLAGHGREQRAERGDRERDHGQPYDGQASKFHAVEKLAHRRWNGR